MRIVVQDGPFNFGAEADRFAQERAVSGAVVTFTGIVRDLGGELQAMEIEHYPGMTEAALTGIAAQAAKRALHHARAVLEGARSAFRYNQRWAQEALRAVDQHS